MARNRSKEINPNKDFNKFFSFSDDVTPFKYRKNLRIILRSKPEKFKNIEAHQKARYSYRNVRVASYAKVDQ